MGRWIVYRPNDFVWVGICKNFVQAHCTRLHLPDPDGWLLGRAEEHQLAIKQRGKWRKVGDPRPRRKGHEPYRGPLTEADQKDRAKRAARERNRRAYKKWGLL